MAVVTDDGLFRYFTCRHPGSIHDSTILLSSELWKDLNDDAKDGDAPCVMLGEGIVKFTGSELLTLFFSNFPCM